MKKRIFSTLLLMSGFYCSWSQQAGEKGILAPGKRVVEKNLIDLSTNNQNQLLLQTRKKQSIQFYVFDLEGALVYQTDIDKKPKILDQLSKGTYLYTAFNNDVNLQEGKLIIK